MKTTQADIDKPRSHVSPLDQTPETTCEAGLVATLEVLIAAGKITRDDVMKAWQLAFVA